MIGTVTHSCPMGQKRPIIPMSAGSVCGAYTETSKLLTSRQGRQGCQLISTVRVSHRVVTQSQQVTELALFMHIPHLMMSTGLNTHSVCLSACLPVNLSVCLSLSLSLTHTHKAKSIQS